MYVYVYVCERIRMFSEWQTGSKQRAFVLLTEDASGKRAAFGSSTRPDASDHSTSSRLSWVCVGVSSDGSESWRLEDR